MDTYKKMNLVSALVLQMAGLWEFPGGKLEHLETAENALIREIKEELDITIHSQDLTPLHFVSHRYKDSYLLMVVYSANRWSGDITPMEGQSVKWQEIAQLRDVEMPLADIPLIEILEKQNI